MNFEGYFEFSWAIFVKTSWEKSENFGKVLGFLKSILGLFGKKASQFKNFASQLQIAFATNQTIFSKI